MKLLARWDPFRELDEFSNSLSGLLGGNVDTDHHITQADWSPLVDITENDKGYRIKVELPEVKREDVKVRVENGVLSISGERNFEKEEKDKDAKVHRIERSYGRFVRSFAVPENTDPGKVTAEFKDGILRVVLPKTEAAAPKQIEIKVA